jgi:hypothetical protein
VFSVVERVAQLKETSMENLFIQNRLNVKRVYGI